MVTNLTSAAALVREPSNERKETIEDFLNCMFSLNRLGTEWFKRFNKGTTLGWNRYSILNRQCLVRGND